MELIGKVVLFIIVVLGIPSFIVWGIWNLVGFVPEPVRAAILTLVPYGIAAAVWVLLAWLCLILLVD